MMKQDPEQTPYTPLGHKTSFTISQNHQYLEALQSKTQDATLLPQNAVKRIWR